MFYTIKKPFKGILDRIVCKRLFPLSHTHTELTATDCRTKRRVCPVYNTGHKHLYVKMFDHFFRLFVCRTFQSGDNNARESVQLFPCKSEWSVRISPILSTWMLLFNFRLLRNNSKTNTTFFRLYKPILQDIHITVFSVICVCVRG